MDTFLDKNRCAVVYEIDKTCAESRCLKPSVTLLLLSSHSGFILILVAQKVFD